MTKKTTVLDLDEMVRLEDLCRAANAQNEPETQWKHFSEEMHELGLARDRLWRNRSTEEDVLEETVDVFMCAVQMGLLHFGPERFNAMLKKKNDKFAEKVSKGFVNGDDGA